LIRRRGKNVGGYCGKRIDIERTLPEIAELAAEQGWISENFLQVAGIGLLGLHRPARGRRSSNRARRVYVSAGIHGDEPAGPLAMLQLFRENRWPLDVDLWICPCLNPDGFAQNRRENSKGIDLNRDYQIHSAAEVQAHIRWLRRQPALDLGLVLHEDWQARGFYLYEWNARQRSLAQNIITSVARVCPIDRSPMIEGAPAENGIIRLMLSRKARRYGSEASYLFLKKTPLVYMLEAPSDFPLAGRVTALGTAVKAALGY
jgi:protein MpaA